MSDRMQPNVLLIYKKSKYQIYYLEKHQKMLGLERVSESNVATWKVAHEHHMAALQSVRDALSRQHVRFKEVYRAGIVRYEPHDVIVSVGGDGTFIEAARRIGNQPILGVNSDPERSVGHYCTTHAGRFEEDLIRLLDGQVSILPLNRLQLEINGDTLPMTALNDVLVSHNRPAAISRYQLSINDESEEHFCSGLWVSTAMGSYGAMRSAGGITLPKESLDLQYQPRELYKRNGQGYTLSGGIVPAGTAITIVSNMREGEISMDGGHCRFPFGYDSQLTISNAPTPVNWVTFDS